MRRREFIAGLGSAAVWPLSARAQQDDRVRALQLQILRLRAEAAADKISNFIKEIESQVGWTTQLPWSSQTHAQRRFDGLRLLRQVPAITNLVQLDASGKEPLTGGGCPVAGPCPPPDHDYSNDPVFTEAVAKKVYYGPVYFRRESEPYMRLSLAGTRLEAGVSVAEVNLKLIWNVVTQMKVGERGGAYVVDGQGRLIVHRDISLVLGNTDMTQLAQVRAARTDGAGASGEAKDIHGRDVLSAYALVAPLGWLVFVEMPIEEAK
jgi:hypothetical protein